MLAKNYQRFFIGRRALWLAAAMVLGMLALMACGDSASSQTDENKQVVSRFIEEFKNKANHDVVDELMTADFVHHLKDPRLRGGFFCSREREA